MSRLAGVEQNGDEHVAHDIDAGTSASDDPVYGHDEGNGGKDDLFRQTGSGEDERQHNLTASGMPATPAPAMIEATTITSCVDNGRSYPSA